MRCIVFVLFMGTLFSQDTLKVKNVSTIYIGEFQELTDMHVKFKSPGDLYANWIMIDKIEYLSNNGKVIIIDGVIVHTPIRTEITAEYIEQLPSHNANVLGVIKTGHSTTTKIGGVCIALAGALQYSTYLDTEKSRKASLEELDDLLDSSINKGKLSAALFIIGGVLIAMDQ